MKRLNEFFDQQMKIPEFKKEYEKIQPEMDIIRAIVDARVSQNLTQKSWLREPGLIRQISANWKMEPEIPH